jgi:hypothetical protein
MERSDEGLSTRDLAGTSERSPDRDPDPPPAEPARGEVIEAEPAGSTAAAEQAPPPDADRSAERVESAEPVAEREPAERSEPADRDVADERSERDASAPDEEPGLLIEGRDDFQSRWEEIQVRFVDEPRGAVEDADELVATVMKSLAEGFAQERERLEAQWGRGEDISTEDLRVALQRYRGFFQRLLST